MVWPMSTTLISSFILSVLPLSRMIYIAWPSGNLHLPYAANSNVAALCRTSAFLVSVLQVSDSVLGALLVREVMSEQTLVALHWWATFEPVYYRGRTGNASSDVRRFSQLPFIVVLSPILPWISPWLAIIPSLNLFQATLLWTSYLLWLLAVTLRGHIFLGSSMSVLCRNRLRCHIYLSNRRLFRSFLGIPSSNGVLSVSVVVNLDSLSAARFFFFLGVPSQIAAQTTAIPTLPTCLSHPSGSVSSLMRCDSFLS